MGIIYPYVKALHIIFIVAWFAGLFYAPRLLIYSVEAQEKPEPEKSILTKQFLIMSSRLWHIITWPAAILSFCFGVWLIVLNPELLSAGWFHIKLLLIFILTVYHTMTYLIFKKNSKNIYSYSSHHLRLWNEVATILLFAIVFVVILKTTFGWIFGTLGLVSLSLLLLLGVKLYKKKRTNSK